MLHENINSEVPRHLFFIILLTFSLIHTNILYMIPSPKLKLSSNMSFPTLQQPPTHHTGRESSGAQADLSGMT
jgi:hypothetical protein